MKTINPNSRKALTALANILHTDIIVFGEDSESQEIYPVTKGSVQSPITIWQSPDSFILLYTREEVSRLSEGNFIPQTLFFKQ